MKNKTINDNYLSTRFIGYFQETKTLSQTGFLEETKWKSQLKKDLFIKQTVVVVICDIVGGGVLMHSGKFVATIKKVISGICDWKKENQKMIYVRKRSFGEDEFILYFKPRSDKMISPLLDSLREKLKNKTKNDSVYIAAVKKDKNTKINYSTLLKLVDKSLFSTKKNAKKNPGKVSSYKPVLITAKNIKIKDVKIKQIKYSPKVITKCPIENLADSKGTFYLFSPNNMKIINTKEGFSGGDKVLKQLSENILKMLKGLMMDKKKIYKIGTMFAVKQNYFSAEQIDIIADQLPFELLYAFVEKTS